MRSRKVFLDIGGYAGESSQAALDPRFGFDAVYCFEPVRACYDQIVAKLKDQRLKVFNAGLLDKDCTAKIHHAGSLGGSIFDDADGTGGAIEVCSFMDATRFFREELHDASQVWMKLNCEGAECPILLNLFSSGEGKKLTEVLLDLDARKIPSAQDQMKALIDRLETAPFSFHAPEEVQYNMITNYGSIRNWLIITGAIDDSPKAYLRSLLYQAKYLQNGYYKARVLRKLRLIPPPSVPTNRGALVGQPSKFDWRGLLQ